MTHRCFFYLYSYRFLLWKSMSVVKGTPSSVFHFTTCVRENHVLHLTASCKFLSMEFNEHQRETRVSVTQWVPLFIFCCKKVMLMHRKNYLYSLYHSTCWKIRRCKCFWLLLTFGRTTVVLRPLPLRQDTAVQQGLALKAASWEHHVPGQSKHCLCCSIMNPFGLIKLGFHLYILTSYFQEELIFLQSAAMSQLAPWRLVYGLSSNGPSSYSFPLYGGVMYLHPL